MNQRSTTDSHKTFINISTNFLYTESITEHKLIHSKMYKRAILCKLDDSFIQSIYLILVIILYK